MWTLLAITFSLLMGQLLGAAALPLSDYNDQLVTYLHPGQPHIQDAPTLLQTMYAPNRVQIYCVRKQPLRVWNIFQSHTLQLRIGRDASYQQYRAPSPLSVYQAYLLRRECYEDKLGASRSLRYIALEPHQLSCYGLYTDEGYTLTLLQCNWDKERLAQFCLGLMLYAAAPLLGQSQTFCQITAAGVGVLLARLAVVYVALLSTRSVHAQSAMKLQSLQDNFKRLLVQHTTAVALALVCGAWLVHSCWQCCSKLWQYACLRYAHRCLLRLAAYYMIYYASAHAEFGRLCLALLLPWPELWYLLQWLRLQLRLCRGWLWRPQVRVLLSVQEFQAQCNYETDVGLRRLRQLLLQHSPARQQVTQRVAQFINGGAHVQQRTSEQQQTAQTGHAVPPTDSMQQPAQDLSPLNDAPTLCTASAHDSSSVRTLYYNTRFTASSRSLFHG